MKGEIQGKFATAREVISLPLASLVYPIRSYSGVEITLGPILVAPGNGIYSRHFHANLGSLQPRPFHRLVGILNGSMIPASKQCQTTLLRSLLL